MDVRPCTCEGEDEVKGGGCSCTCEGEVIRGTGYELCVLCVCWCLWYELCVLCVNEK